MRDTVRPAKLPLWRPVRESYGWGLGHLGEVVKQTWPVLAVLAAVSFALHWLAHPYLSVSGSQASQWITMIVIPAATIVFGAMIAVPWHRFVLDGEPLRNVSLRLPAGVPAYIAWAILLVAPLYAFFFFLSVWPGLSAPEAADDSFDVTGVTGFVLGLGAFFAVSFVLTRLWIKLVAVALGDDNGTVGQIWRVTAWNFWRLFWGTLATMAPFILFVIALLYFVPDESSSRSAYALANALVTIAEVLLGLISLTFLSLAYRHFLRPASGSQLK